MKAVLLPIFKKDDRVYCDNYRGINLLDISEIFVSILRNRLMEVRDSIISPNQGGFRPDRSMVTKYSHQERKERKGKVKHRFKHSQPNFTCFSDFTFNSINRTALQRVMKYDAVSDIHLIKAFSRYIGTRIWITDRSF